MDSVAFNVGGRTLAAGAHNGTLLLVRLERGDLLDRQLQVSESSLTALAFAPDGKALAVVGLEDESVELLDPARRAPRRRLPVRDPVTAVTFSPDGRLLATGTENGRVVLFDPRAGSRLWALPMDGGRVGAVAFSPDGRLLATGTEEGSVVMSDPGAGSRQWAIAGRRRCRPWAGLRSRWELAGRRHGHRADPPRRSPR